MNLSEKASAFFIENLLFQKVNKFNKISCEDTGMMIGFKLKEFNSLNKISYF